MNMIAIIAAVLSGTAIAAPCPEGQTFAEKYPTYLIGEGHGVDSNEAKSRALIDLGSSLAPRFRFATRYSGAWTSAPSNGRSRQSLDNTLTLDGQAEVPKVEELFQCEGVGANITLVVGVQKSLLAAMIEGRAKTRLSEVKIYAETCRHVAGPRRYADEEKHDLALWIAVGRTAEWLPRVSTEMWGQVAKCSPSKDDEQVVWVAHDDHLAQTLARATGTAVRIHHGGNRRTGLTFWECSQLNGDLVGLSQRIRVVCQTPSAAAPHAVVSLEGMAAPKDTELAARDLILKYAAPPAGGVTIDSLMLTRPDQ